MKQVPHREGNSSLRTKTNHYASPAKTRRVHDAGGGGGGDGRRVVEAAPHWPVKVISAKVQWRPYLYMTKSRAKINRSHRVTEQHACFCLF